MKRLQNVEGKNEEQLKEIKDQGEQQLKLIESDANSAKTKAFQNLKFLNRLNTKAKEWFNRIKK